MRSMTRNPRVFCVTAGLVLALAMMMGCGLASPKLAGSVRDAVTGAPVADALVRGPGQSTKTDPQGEFVVRLSEGTHELAVEAAGYVQQVVEATVGSGSEAELVEVRLEPRRLQGVVRTEAGEPLPGARVSLGEQASIVDDAGAFELDATSLGELTIAADCYQPVEVAAADLEALYAPSGEQQQLFEVALAPRLLQGQITDRFTGEPVADVEVSLGSQEATTGPDGLYTLLACAAGTELQLASATHRAPDGVAYEGQAQQDVTLEPWWTLLQVVDAQSGAGLPGVLVESDAGFIETEEDGQVAVMVRPGASLTIDQFGYRPAALTYQGEETITIELESVGLAGMLTDAETGEVVTRATVQAFEPGKEEPILCYPDEQGRFVLEEPQQIERILVKAPGYALSAQPVGDEAVVEVALEPFAVKGIYITFGRLADRAAFESLLQLVEDTELNAVVIDVKSDRGWLAWPSEVPLAQEMGLYREELMDLREAVKMCHDRGIYAIARMVIFKDQPLATARPDWAAKWSNGTLYTDFEGLAWMDPFRQEVRDYNLALTMEVVDIGFDEIQYDYIRFASDGVRGVVYSQEDDADTRTAAVTEMVRQAHEALAKTPAFFSVDLFGLTPWVEPPADMGIGQRVADIAAYADFVCPMLYPTTFTRGNLGYEVPGNHPYDVVYRSTMKHHDRTETLVRPWIQAYSIGSFVYGPVELLLQIRAAEEAGSSGWLFWHAATRYDAEVFLPDAWERYPDAGGPPQVPQD